MLAGAVLLLTLVFYGVLGVYAPYLLLLLALLICARLAFARAQLRVAVGSAELGFGLAFAFIAVIAAINAHRPTDVLIVVNFLWLLLFAPLLWLMRSISGPRSAVWIARLALLGVALIFAIALYERLAIGSVRVGRLTSDPVRISNTAVILGSIALVGCAAISGKERFLYLCGPPLAFAVAFLAGTRAAMFATAVLVVACIPFLVRNRRVAVISTIAAGAVGVAGFLLAILLHAPRIETIGGIVGQLLGGQPVGDESASIRLTMMRAAIGAFLDHPWSGYGWQHIMSAAKAHLPEDEGYLLARQPHLHSDLADFGVAGGLLGLAAYLTILLTPLVAVLRSARDELYRLRLLSVTILTASYLILGLNSLMFGFEVHTALFCSLAAIMLGYCRSVPEVAGKAT